MDDELMARIESNSTWEPNTGCRLWLGGARRDQGLVKWRGKSLAVHRVAWEYANGGPVPVGAFVLHRCGVGVCSNPAHLYLGDRLQNASDRKGHGRYRGFQSKGNGPGIVDSPFKRTTRPSREGVPSAEELRASIAYDPETGRFRWLHRDDRERDWNTRWAGKTAGKILGNGYLYINIGKKPRLAHRLAWLYMTGEWPAAQIDHINRDRADNRWANLRAATNQENALNQGIRSTNKSGVTGVSWDKRKKRWYATITVNGKMLNLGRYDRLEDAVAARRSAELRYRKAA